MWVMSRAGRMVCEMVSRRVFERVVSWVERRAGGMAVRMAGDLAFGLVVWLVDVMALH